MYDPYNIFNVHLVLTCMHIISKQHDSGAVEHGRKALWISLRRPYKVGKLLWRQLLLRTLSF